MKKTPKKPNELPHNIPSTHTQNTDKTHTHWNLTPWPPHSTNTKTARDSVFLFHNRNSSTSLISPFKQQYPCCNSTFKHHCQSTTIETNAQTPCLHKNHRSTLQPHCLSIIVICCCTISCYTVLLTSIKHWRSFLLYRLQKVHFCSVIVSNHALVNSCDYLIVMICLFGWITSLNLIPNFEMLIYE